MTQAEDESISGLVERVTFHSEETGFAVLRAKVKGHRDLVAVVGTVSSIHPGEWIDALGHWHNDARHGEQFKAKDLRVTEPDTLDGIEKYLGSGLIKGIGPVYAKKLVKHFGREVFDIIEKRSAMLEKVEGIGPGRRRIIKEAWNEQKVVREIMTFLFSHGVTTSRAFRIYKTYGEQAIDRVRNDPYCLARDIRGIGFKTADQIASHLGVEKDSDLRVRAGVEYVLQEVTSEGHCAFPRLDLITKTAEILDVEEEFVERAVEYGLSTERLMSHQFGQEDALIYLVALDRAEHDLARDLVRLIQGPHPCQELNVERAIPWVEESLGFELEAAQRDALRSALQSKVMIITGGPGVGKTTLVNSIVRIFQAKKQRVVLCAPTGRAAKRMSELTGRTAKTVHRLLIFDPKTGDFKHNAEHPLKGDVFVVDETSMVDVKLAHQLVRAIPPQAALVLIGDVDQLPSVGPGSVLRDIIQSDVVPVARLKHVFRQAAASAIITNAHRVNDGVMPKFPDGKLAAPGDTDFYFVETEEASRGVELITKMVRDSLPNKFGLNMWTDLQVLSPMQRGELGAKNLNVQLQAALNPNGVSVERFGITFREGDKVMQMQNDYDKDVYNGDIGRIERIDLDELIVLVEFDGRSVDYKVQELDELSLAYATTIHKSQGSEYPCVIMPIHTQHFVMLQRNLLYTGITRGKRLVIVVGTKKALAMAVKNVDSRRRFTTLTERLKTLPT